jgi:hypothetical protein
MHTCRARTQFIVVSLKHGMFNNANVIFKTKFVGGVSTVMRMVGGGAAIEDADGGGAPAAAAAPSRGGGGGGGGGSGRGRGKARPTPAAAAAAAAAAAGGENGGDDDGDSEFDGGEDVAPRRKAKAARTASSRAGAMDEE